MSVVIDTLERQCGSLLSLVEGLTSAEWQMPTRCPPMTVKDLCAHCAKAAEMTAKLAAMDASGREINVDRARWWVSKSRRPPADILAEALETSAALDGEGVAALLRERARELMAELRAHEPDAVVGNESRTITVEELAGSRCLELGVHTMDLGQATGRGERINADTATIVTGILDTLLGSPPPPELGWSPETYILAGTGRRDLTPDERRMLGPLADRFPVLR